MSNPFWFYMPQASLFGEGCVNQLGEEIARAGNKKCLLITDKAMVSLGLCEKLVKQINSNNIKAEIYSEVCPNPTADNVHRAYEAYTAKNCDCIVTLGGGSAHDCGKAVSILATNGGKCQDHLGKKTKHRGCNLFAVNTTAGTASEITTTYVITDTKTHQKMIFEDSNCLSAVAFNDPLLLLSLPPSLTASTGMDALTHAIECYVSSFSAPVTTALALCAAKVIGGSLKKSVLNPQSLTYRSEMSAGQYIAGMAFGNGGVGIAHSLAHQLGGVYNIPHGIANAILLPYVIEFNMSAAKEAYENVFNTLKQAEPTVKGEDLVQWIKSLNTDIGITQRLKDLGVAKESIPQMAKDALNDVCTATNPVIPTASQLEEIFTAAW